MPEGSPAALAVLIGAAGSGKSTAAAQAWEPRQVLSLDELRAAVAGDVVRRQYRQAQASLPGLAAEGFTAVLTWPDSARWPSAAAAPATGGTTP
jgi:hypothetical protein